MSCNKQLGIIFIICAFCIFCQVGSSDRALSRKRRYIVFPEGSSFSIALCMTVHTLTPDNIFTEGLNWGISYDLPNESKPALEPYLELRNDKLQGNWHLRKGIKNQAIKSGSWYHDQKYLVPKKYYKAHKYYLQRRHRRDLYNKVEVIMNAMGFDGRTCVLRALCEASQRFMPKGNTLVEELIRITFSLPLKRVFSFEPQEHHTYTDAHKAGHEGRNCATIFPGCSFSLIDMALGRYNAREELQPANNLENYERDAGTLDMKNSETEKYFMK